MPSNPLQALYQAKDAQLPLLLTEWIELKAPLPPNTVFVPINPVVHDSMAWGSLFIAIAFAIACLGLMYVGAEAAMILTMLVIVFTAALTSGWHFYQHKNTSAAYQAALKKDIWRLGYLLHPEFYYSRTRKNDVYLIPREAILKFYTGTSKIQLGQGQSRRSLWLAVQYRLTTGKTVELLLHEITVGDQLPAVQTTQAKVNQWKDDYKHWLDTGNVEFFPDLFRRSL